MTRKVYIVAWPHSGDTSVAQMYKEHGWDRVSELSDADLAQFCGGDDVTPSLYGQAPHRTTANDVNRDNFEEKIYNEALEQGIPCAGICRGGQFLHVMNGGDMWQDVDGHMGPHMVNMLGKLVPLQVSSDHHQMMQHNANTKDRAITIMYANQASSKEKMSSGKYQNVKYMIKNSITGVWNKDDDLEAVFYPDTNCLCFQPHPEYKGYKDCTAAFFFALENYTFGAEKEEVVVSNDKETCPDCQKQAEFCDC